MVAAAGEDTVQFDALHKSLHYPIVTLLFATGAMAKIVPTSGIVVTEAWRTFVVYANFRLPPEPNGFYGYNALQQLVYFAG